MTLAASMALARRPWHTLRGARLANHAAAGPQRHYAAACPPRLLLPSSRDFATRKDDLVCLSMGAIADCVWIPDLLRAYWRSPVPWVILVQGNGEHIVTSEEQRETLRRFYAKAKTVVFVSRQNVELAERQLAWRFHNAVVIPNPIRERLNEPLPWPPLQRGTWRFAESLARFEVPQNAQDQLLEALATAQWKARPWAAEPFMEPVPMSAIFARGRTLMDSTTRLTLAATCEISAKSGD